MKNKYNNGYLNPLYGHKNTNYENNIYKEYNNSQIKLWHNYITNINIIKDYEINHGYYNTLKNTWKRIDNTIQIAFEHDYIANQLLSNKLSKENTVHHIDKNGQNNDKYNLLVFETNADHKRYHNSKYAKLMYNEETHLFTCYLDKRCEI